MNYILNVPASYTFQTSEEQNKNLGLLCFSHRKGGKYNKQEKLMGWAYPSRILDSARWVY